MENKEEQVKDRIIEVGNTALDVIEAHLKGGGEDARLVTALRVLTQSGRVLQMKQVRTLTERSQALRLLPFFPNDEARNDYIKRTQPQVPAKLLDRPRGS